MKTSILHSLGLQLKEARTRRGLTQPQLSARLGRDRARISELERELIGERVGRDRLALLVEICDALNLTPVLVPNARLQQVKEAIVPHQPRTAPSAPTSTAFDDVFVDLSEPGDV